MCFSGEEIGFEGTSGWTDCAGRGRDAWRRKRNCTRARRSRCVRLLHRPQRTRQSVGIRPTGNCAGDGGKAAALRVDHTQESEVVELLDRIMRDRARIDVVVNCIAGEDPMMSQWGSFWAADLRNGEEIVRPAILSTV